MSKISAADLRNAAKRVSSVPPSGGRNASGARDPEGPWKKLQGKTARVIMSSPDVLLYFSYLCSNQASVKVRTVMKELETLIPLVEGLRKEQEEVPSAESTAKQVQLTVSSGYLDLAKIPAIEKQVDSFIAKELVPSIKAGSRLQKKGVEARSAFERSKAALLKKWDAMMKYLRICGRPFLLDTDLLRQSAAEVPMKSLLLTLSMKPPSENLTAYTLQTAASLAALKGMAREVRLECRVLEDETSVFPSGMAITKTYEAGLLSSLSFNKSPKELGIRSGDIVTWGGKTAVVRLVSDTGVTLKESSISSGATGTLKIEAEAYPAWKVLIDDLQTATVYLPSAQRLQQRMHQKEGPSAADARNLVEYLASLYVRLDELPSSILTVLSRVGGEAADVSPAILPTLTGYQPFFSSKMIKVGDGVLRELEKEGFDYAKDMLLQGDIDTFFLSTALGASKSARLLEHARTVSASG
jgi:hypothetical protein